MKIESKRNLKKKEGISLIVLVITIIVMIILAAAVVISLSNNGIIGKANEAVEQTNLKQVQTVAQTLWAEGVLKGDSPETIRGNIISAIGGETVAAKYDIDVTETEVTVKIATNSGENGGTDNDDNSENVETVTVTITGTTAWNESYGMFLDLAPTRQVSGNEGILDAIPPKQIIIDGVEYLYDEEIDYIGNPYLLNPLGYSYEDNGMDFVFIGYAFITKEIRNYTISFSSKGYRVEYETGEITLTFSEGSKLNAGGKCGLATFEIPTFESRVYHCANIVFDGVQYNECISHLSGSMDRTNEGDDTLNPMLGFGNKRIYQIDSDNIDTTKPFYMVLEYTDDTYSELYEARAYVEDTSTTTRTLSMTFITWVPVATD